MVYIVQRKMDAYIDELLGNTDIPFDNTELCKQDSSPSVDISSESVIQKHRERLAALAAGGQAKQYGLVVRGKVVAADQIDVLDDDEVEKLYARYEARLGAAVTRTLGQAALQIYSKLASSFLPIPSQSALVHDLEVDPFVRHALSSVTCELYHRYGMFLTLLNTVNLERYYIMVLPKMMTAPMEEDRVTKQKNPNRVAAGVPVLLLGRLSKNECWGNFRM